MKKILALILVLMMIFTVTACSTVNDDGSVTPAGVAIEQAIVIAARAIEAALAIAATWLLSKMRKRKELQNTQIALEILFDITRQTVGELQQTLVEDWKKEGGGKLNKRQIDRLGSELLRLVQEKLDTASKNLIEAAGMDITALITGAAEDWINTNKQTGGLVYIHREPMDTE